MSLKRKREQQIVTAVIGLVFLIVLIGLGLLIMTMTRNVSSSEAQELPTAYFAAPPTHATATP